jgi:hypothetical protein
VSYFKTLFVPLLVLFSFIASLNAETVDIKTLPPVVIRTFPVAGATMVDPSTRKIYVTFSQKMKDKMWSFVMQNQETFPQLNGDPSYDKAMRTCTMNVILEPGKTYVIWINSGKFMNFKGVNGQKAIPYMLSFKTAGKEFDSQKEASIKASEVWLKLLQEGKFEDSWNESSPYFKSQVTKDIWTKQISLIYSKLGKLKSRKFLSAAYAKKLPNAPDGKYFILRFSASFEQKPKVVETIVPMLTKDGHWKISGYFLK